MYCQNCGKEIRENATYCKHCAYPVEASGGPRFKNKTNEKAETVSILLILLALCIPIAGIIVGAVRFNEHPDTSKIYIWCGIGSFIFSSIVLAFC